MLSRRVAQSKKMISGLALSKLSWLTRRCKGRIFLAAAAGRRYIEVIMFSAMVLPVTPGIAGEQPGDRVLADAFGAISGGQAHMFRETVRPSASPSQDGSKNRMRNPILTITPSLLIELGRGRYALVVSEKQDGIGHVYGGAIGVAYLHRNANRWTLDEFWPELAWTGNTGQPADAIIGIRIGSHRLVVTSSLYMGQGQGTTTALVISLGDKNPVALGHLIIGGSYLDDCSVCDRYEYKGIIKPPQQPGELFRVAYSGWTGPPTGKPGPRRLFHAETGYVQVKSGLEARPPLEFLR